MNNYIMSMVTCLLLLGAVIILPTSVQAQSKRQLQKQKKRLYDEIEIAQRLLKDTRADRKNSMQELVLLEKRISNRQEIIENINQHIALIEGNISANNAQIDSLNTQLVTLKETYANMVQDAYLTQSSYSKLMFLFSAEDFNEAYRRFKYMQYYRDHRQNQIATIVSAQDSIVAKVQLLETEKEEQQKLLTEQERERSVLENEKNDKGALLKNLKKKEKNVKYQLQKKQTALDELNRQIQAIIAKATSTKTNAQGKVIPPSPESTKLSKQFAKNKGKLPWPVAKGVVTGKFGTNRHPVLKHITTTNNGIDITTQKESIVWSVFNGQVTNILFNPSFQWAVIVKHGEYFTVYSNLVTVNVAKGDKISTKQQIGTVHTDPNDGKTAVHLEVWKGNTKLNPIKWIARK